MFRVAAVAEYFNMHPLPRQTDRSYMDSYICRIMAIEDRLKLTAPKNIVSPEAEPLLEAAEPARMGKNIVVQHGYTATWPGSTDCGGIFLICEFML